MSETYEGASFMNAKIFGWKLCNTIINYVTDS
jgi:hypothetical protein